MVGIVGTTTYFGMALGLVSIGAGVTLAHCTAYVVSQLVSYLGQKNFTFRVRGQHARISVRFLTAMAFLAVAQFLVVLGMRALAFGPTLTFLASSVFYPAASWVLHTTWTFRPAKAITAQFPQGQTNKTDREDSRD